MCYFCRINRQFCIFDCGNNFMEWGREREKDSKIDIEIEKYRNENNGTKAKNKKQIIQRKRFDLLYFAFTRSLVYDYFLYIRIDCIKFTICIRICIYVGEWAGVCECFYCAINNTTVCKVKMVLGFRFYFSFFFVFVFLCYSKHGNIVRYKHHAHIEIYLWVRKWYAQKNDEIFSSY